MHTSDDRVHACIAVLRRWVDGQARYDGELRKAVRAAETAAYTAWAAAAAEAEEAAEAAAEAERARQVEDIVAVFGRLT